MNLMSLIEFVSVFLLERRNTQNFIILTRNEFPRRFDVNIELSEDIAHTFIGIHERITTDDNSQIHPRFRDEFSAVYHYYKHRYIEYEPESSNEEALSVREYFALIRDVLRTVIACYEYQELGDPQNTRNSMKIETSVLIRNEYTRRVILVLKFQVDRVVITTCYFFFSDDEERANKLFIDDRER